MCGLCGMFGAVEHWTQGVGAAGARRRADRQHQVRLANAVLKLHGLRCADWQDRFTVTGPTGRGSVVPRSLKLPSCHTDAAGESHPSLRSSSMAVRQGTVRCTVTGLLIIAALIGDFASSPFSTNYQLLTEPRSWLIA